MIKGKIVVFDLETTGLDTNHDEIIEFAAWRFEDGRTPECLHFLVRPQRKVPPRILRLTRITEEELLKAAPLEEHRLKIIEFLQDAVLVGHNASFDLLFLQNSLGVNFSQEVWDTLELARIFFPAFNQYRLSALAGKLKLEPLDTASDSVTFHRAKTDAWVTWKLLEACWQKGLEFDLSFFATAEPLIVGWNGRTFFNKLKKEITKKFPTRPIRTGLVLAPLTDGLFQDESRSGKLPNTPEWIEECFLPGGILEKNLPGYESRRGQVKMAKLIAEGLTAGKHLVIEAGTGTGKSFAYLIPGLWWAKKTGKKIIVATHTIPLQEQLYKKDLPVLARILPFSFRSALLKGKGNYLCLKRWLFQTANPHELSAEEKIAFLSMLVWIRETTTGDLQEVSQIPGISKLWPRLSAENESCNPFKCPEAGVCFLLRARKRAEEADLVIVNHSLLFSDIKTDYNVLPEYHELIIDEAHHLYQTALEQLGISLSLEQIVRTVEMIYRPKGVSLYGTIKHKPGYWTALMSVVIWDSFITHLEDLPKLCRLLLEQTQELFKSLALILGDKQSFRLTPVSRQEAWWPTLEVQVENLSGRLQELIQKLESLERSLSGEEHEELAALYREIVIYKRELEGFREGFSLALNLDDRGRVTWLEQAGTIYFKTSPVEVSEILREKVFSRLDSAILTSATLSIAGSFKYFLEEVGLSPDIETIQVESPFDYNQQMRFLIVKDLFDARQSELFNSWEVAKFIAAVAERMQGRTLVLFTSHRLLRDTYIPLQKILEQAELQVLGQGIDGGRGAILEEFLRNPKSVLLGANSFWEGIDIPGEALSCVVLVKLPFWPPNMPLIEARSELLESQGRNSFQEFLLPQAVLRFKQGFGRLIRSKGDRGLVILLDARAIEKYYGRVFLSSLPVQTHIRGKTEDILEKIDLWIEGDNIVETLF